MSWHLWQVHDDLPREPLRLVVPALGYCCLILVTSEDQAKALNVSVPPPRLVVSRTATPDDASATSMQVAPPLLL
jgi:hypothetical protein